MHVTGLFCYPVKSLRGHAVDSALIELAGMEDDRRWMVVDRGGRMRTIRQIPAMTQIAVEQQRGGVKITHAKHGSILVETPKTGAATRQVEIWRDKVAARPTNPAVSMFLTATLGEELDLVFLDDPHDRPVDQEFGRPDDFVTFADGFPILIATTGSLDRLNEVLPAPVPMARFRPNIVIDTSTEWAEDSWKLIRIGDLVLRIVKPCSRCVITTRDQETGEQPDPREPLMTLGKIHRSAKGGIIFGQNAIPDTAARIAVGDAVEVLESGASNLLREPEAQF